MRNAPRGFEGPLVDVLLADPHGCKSYWRGSYIPDVATGIIAGLGAGGQARASIAFAERLATAAPLSKEA